MEEILLYEQHDGVVTLTINRPEMRNAISDPDMLHALIAAAERINLDRSVRAVILTGAGTAFSSGGNVKAMRERLASGGHGESVNTRYHYRDGIQRMVSVLSNLEVPLIAAVNGPAIGAGNDLACICDIRIAADTAVFAESFVKIGIIPGDGGAWLLPRAVGMSRACEMAFTGDAIDAQTALAWGLVSRVVPAEQLLDAARDLARRIARNPGHALRMTKRLMKEGQHARLDTLLELSAGFQSLAHQSADHREALDALLEKRPPRFNAGFNAGFNT
ncbi:crotonase/enoyl-CoA hydratase family protein [Paraburkholderia sp.]|uniref:crotonase/enoyl-CoA hydratase family protein n=1 Tax=Paraburkholderia sp. TaxID=1926495 RepID=UPI0025CBF8FD|nr:crotonase/enoyl-CoA hydratase family protein [Paraburkholderia sp.]